MKKVVYLLGLMLLASCGSYNKAERQQTDQTSTVTSSSTENMQAVTNASSESSETQVSSSQVQTDDSTETVTVTKTTWYDTSRTDSNGVAPVLKEETVTSMTRRGKRTTQGSEQRKDSDSKSQSQTTVQNSATKEESAKSDIRTTTTKDVSASETKQVQYTAWMLFGIAFVIIAAVLAYWFFSKYRQRSRQ